MGRKRNYVLYTLDGREIMNLCERKDRKFDLNSQYDRDKILIDENRFAECALFYQIIEAAYRKGDRRTRREILTKSLVYLVFKNGVAGQEKKTKDLLAHGFELKFAGDDDYVHFVPFDKSASMSRNNTLSFIDSDIFYEVDKALDMGFDKSKLEFIPSKYYAYRGLYLTDGTAV